jgi:hypothetical protein
MNLSRGATMAAGVKVENVSPEELYEVMVAASSQDPAQLQASSKRLKQMLDMFGTFDALHEIAAQRTTVPVAVRQQSIIQFKNAALHHWKSRKSAVKPRSMNTANEIVNIGCFQMNTEIESEHVVWTF